MYGLKRTINQDNKFIEGISLNDYHINMKTYKERYLKKHISEKGIVITSKGKRLIVWSIRLLPGN